MPSLSVERCDDLAALPRDIEEAFATARNADFHGTLDWYRLLARTSLPAAERARLYVLRRDGRPIAALPMRCHRTDGYQQLGALANFYTTRFVPLLGDEVSCSDLTFLLRAIRRERPRAAGLDLAPLDKGGAAFERLRAAMRAAGYVTFEYFRYGNWFLPVTQNSNDYLAARPGEVRSTLRRMGKRFAAAGGRVEVFTAGGDAARARDAFLAVYAQSWKQPEPFPAFMPAFIDLCNERGWLRLGVAWLGDVPIAAQVWVVAGGKANIYKLAYDSRHRSHSPGTLLTASLMRHVIDDDRVREVDYLTGDDAYKRDWMTERRELWGLVGYDPRHWRGLALALREHAARGAKRAWRRETGRASGLA